MGAVKPELRIVSGSKPKRVPMPDSEARRLLRRRSSLEAELRRVHEALFAHRRRKADERGRIPPLTIDELIDALGIAR